jgi:hypothetical protein
MNDLFDAVVMGYFTVDDELRMVENGEGDCGFGTEFGYVTSTLPEGEYCVVKILHGHE